MAVHPAASFFSPAYRPSLAYFPPRVPGHLPATPVPSLDSTLEDTRGGKGRGPPVQERAISDSTCEGSADSDAGSPREKGQCEGLPQGAGLSPAWPRGLHCGFDHLKVQTWDPNRFQLLSKIQDASRNSGQVLRMRDTAEGRSVAVKRMPNSWVCRGPSEFKLRHPGETELPWQDIGCTALLNASGFPYVCGLLGVYRDDAFTHVVMEYAAEGDLFTWCNSASAGPLGPLREAAARPLVVQILEATRQLHEMAIVHSDLSLENILLTRPAEKAPVQVQVIDFGMASTSRYLRSGVRGKPSYQAPELHLGEGYDGFLADAFSIGVMVYAMLVQDLPWLSTRNGGCKCFEYVRRHGFRAYAAKRKVRDRGLYVADCLSEPAMQLLEGLLAFDPAQRLTMGERCFGAASGSRASVWMQEWLTGYSSV